MRVAVAHAGTHALRISRALAESGDLSLLASRLAVTPEEVEKLARILPRAWRPAARDLLAKRTVPEIVGPCLERFASGSDLAFALAERAGLLRRPALRRRLIYQGIRRYEKAATARVMASRPDLVVSYEGTAREVFRAAAGAGIPRVLDMAHPHPSASAYWMERAREEWPEWALSDDSPFLEADQVARIDEELALADTVICASKFSASWVTDRVSCTRVVPYSDPVLRSPNQPRERGPGSPLHVLFLGSVGLRKGVPVLLAAATRVGRLVELRLVGPVLHGVPGGHLSGAIVTGRVPATALRDQMAWADVLVLPSYVEGFGQVLIEAMSEARPVIASANTAGPDIVPPGLGWIVPPGDVNALAAALEAAVGTDTAAMGEALRSAMNERLSWEGYARSIREVLRDAIVVSEGRGESRGES